MRIPIVEEASGDVSCGRADDSGTACGRPSVVRVEIGPGASLNLCPVCAAALIGDIARTTADVVRFRGLH